MCGTGGLPLRTEGLLGTGMEKVLRRRWPEADHGGCRGWVCLWTGQGSVQGCPAHWHPWAAQKAACCPVSPGAELCWKAVVRTSRGNPWSAQLTLASCLVATVGEIWLFHGPTVAETCVLVRGGFSAPCTLGLQRARPRSWEGPPLPGPDLPGGSEGRICTLSQCLFFMFSFL